MDPIITHNIDTDHRRHNTYTPIRKKKKKKDKDHSHEKDHKKKKQDKHGDDKIDISV